MKFKDLLTELKTWDEHKGYFSDFEICIPVEDSTAIGATPSVPGKDATVGIDWDHGKIFIHPEKSLTTVQND